MKSTDARYPLHPRGALELFDVSLKLYKKYFWPLLGVSALLWVTVAFVQFLFTSSLQDLAEGVVIAILFSALFAFFLLPFLYGAVCCCLVAAFEAREVSFRDCMRFAAARYGRILSAVAKVVLSAFLAFLLYTFLLYLIAFGMTLIVDVLPLFNNWAIFPYLAIAVVVSLTTLYVIGFFCLAPLVACLEEKQNGAQLRKRCFVISWSGAKALISLVFLNGLGFLVLLTILGGLTGVGTSLVITHDYMRGASSDSGALFSILAAITSFTFVGMFWSPFYLLTLGTFYFDVRIRKEAFDLEYQLTHPDRI